MKTNNLVADVVESWTPFGMVRHLKVSRKDGKDGITWDQPQEMKNCHLGRESFAVEVYPPQDHVVDEANIRHLWELPDHMARFGLHQR